MIEHVTLLADTATDRPTNDAWDIVIGLALIGLAITAWQIARSPKARRSVGRATGRAAIGTMRATGRPIRAIGRRSRSGLIGHWGRGVVGCEARAAKAAEAGKHDRARTWRAMGDAMIGSSRIACHVPGCSWEQDPPQLPDVVAHLRSHRDNKQTTNAETKPSTETNNGDQPATATKGETMDTITAAETIPDLALLLDQNLIPAAQREAEAAEAAAQREANLAASVQGSLENMASMGMPGPTLARLQNAVDAATSAAGAAKSVASQTAEVRDALTAARAAIRGQEAVTEAASAAGGAMDRAAYAG